MITAAHLTRARRLRPVAACNHTIHTHHGTRGGRCQVCGTKWCTTRAYDCEICHPEGTP